MWVKSASLIESKGLTAEKATSLADLHRRRRETESQYFTPSWVAKGIWQSFAPIIEQSRSAGVKRFYAMDTAIGSGRLLNHAPTDVVSLYGLDKDSRCIDSLCADANEAGIDYEFIHGDMSNLRASGMHFAVINPPFSIHLDSPNLTPYESNSFGKYGQGTSAISHEYALEQALDAALCVAAILPLSMDSYCRQKPNLQHIIQLPKNTFISEGANVETAVYFFTPSKCISPGSTPMTEQQSWPSLGAQCFQFKYYKSPQFRLHGTDHTKDVITAPVTGISTVELHHHNRRIVLKYHCGLVQARVANGLLGKAAAGNRLPKGMKYIGQGKFLLDVMLLQENPDDQLNILAQQINEFGGHAWISPTLSGYYTKLLRKHRRAITPMYRMVKATSTDACKIKAQRRTLLEPRNFNSPGIAKGTVLEAIPDGAEYRVTYKGSTVTLRRDEILTRFSFLNGDELGNESKWEVLHPGLNHHFPALHRQYKTIIEKMGINWLAPFQEDSLIEGLISPYGYLGGWEQGSGKARYSIALALLHSGHNMIVVESGLMPEMLAELKKLGIDQKYWKQLKAGDEPTAKINLTTYATLRSGTRIQYMKTVKIRNSEKEVFTNKVIDTCAQKWRRNINTLICDEGGLLANANTRQTQAVKSLGAKKLIILDGTPQRNYPRDLLPLSVVSAGNGVAHQPYGTKGNVHVAQNLINTISHSQRGEDAFFDNHVVTQWVTNEFKEDMQSGGKREVPKINNLSLFREWLAPNIQRRLRNEPDLAIFNNCPAPERENIKVGWDDGHFSHYIKVATEFAQWYKRGKLSNSNLSMVTVLARIGAVQRAANSPHVDSKSSMATYTPLTSKQRLAIERLQYWVNDGRKVILYAKSPEVLTRLHYELSKMGVDSVLFTGQQNINQRAKALNDEFKHGNTDVLLSSWVGQRGLNLEQASAVVFYERDWSATTEEQAIARTLRPTQQATVVAEYLHLAGSIDEYCAQLVEWKKNAADAGLDFGNQVEEEEEFMHLDTMLHRFCDDVLKMSLYEVKETLVA